MHTPSEIIPGENGKCAKPNGCKVERNSKQMKNFSESEKQIIVDCDTKDTHTQKKKEEKCRFGMIDRIGNRYDNAKFEKSSNELKTGYVFVVFVVWTCNKAAPLVS